MPVVPLTGQIKASDIRGAVNDIDTDGPGDLNYTQINLSTAATKLHTLQGRTNAPSSGEMSFSQFRGSQAISVYVTVKGETPSIYYDTNNDGSITVSIVGSKVTSNVSTEVTDTDLDIGSSKTGINPAPWAGLNQGAYDIEVTDLNTGFSTLITVSVPLSTSTSYYTVNVAP